MTLAACGLPAGPVKATLTATPGAPITYTITPSAGPTLSGTLPASTASPTQAIVLICGTPQAPTAGQTGKAIYLTFDDGPDALYTPQIVLALQSHRDLNGNSAPAHATFFVIGKDMDENGNITTDRILPNKNVLQMIKNNGNAIGIHGLVHGAGSDGWHNSYFWNHPLFQASSIDEEVSMLNGTGVAPDHLMRAPGGAFRPQPFPGYTDWYYYGWDIDSGDGGSGTNGLSAEGITKNVLDGLTNLPDKPIILLHSTNPYTAEAIINGSLLAGLERLGYTQFLSLPRPCDLPGYPPIGRVQTTSCMVEGGCQ